MTCKHFQHGKYFKHLEKLLNLLPFIIPDPCIQSSPLLPGGKKEPAIQSTTLACVFGTKSPVEEYFYKFSVLNPRVPTAVDSVMP